MLKDVEKRAAYDQLGSDWKSGQQFRPPPDWASGFEFGGGSRPRARGAHVFEEEGFSDFFSSLFGGASPFGAAGRRQQAGRDHHARIDIDLEEAFGGGTRTLDLKRPELKPDGALELRSHTVRVTIPAGVTDGQPIRLAGQGEASAGGGRAGDLYLEVHIRPHRFYQVEGRDVTLTLPVAPWEAALGADGYRADTRGHGRDAGTRGPQSGQKLRLRGRGLPGQPAGDAYVQLKVVLPPANSPAARASTRRCARSSAASIRAPRWVDSCCGRHWPKRSAPAARYASSSAVLARLSARLRCGKRPKRAMMERCSSAYSSALANIALTPRAPR